MDAITHGILGAAFGEAWSGERLGRRAMWLGALGCALPDIDVVSRLAGPWAEMEHHRGFTHSAWFGPVVGPLLGWAVWRWYRRRYDPAALGAASHPGAPGMLRELAILLSLAILLHVILDLFTTYGTQLLAPFSRARYALDGIAIVDPLFSLVLLVGLFAGRGARAGARAPAIALAVAAAYLFFGVWQNRRAAAAATEQLVAQGVHVTEVRAHPTLLQVFQHRVVAFSPGALHVGEISTWAPRPVKWHVLPQPDDPLVQTTRDRPEGRLFTWYTLGEDAARVVQTPEETVVELDDQRYGAPRSAEGIWGIRARYAPDGAPRGPVEYFRRPNPDDLLGAAIQLFRDTFAPEPGG